MTQTASKELTVLARCTFKGNAKAVKYLVLSSNEVDKYETTIYNGKATACSCPSKVRCYHMNGCEKLEASRYNVIEAAIDVVKSVEDALYGDCYEVRAEQIKRDQERTALLNYELSLGI